jgi:two-component sensor histidine kinase
LQQGRIERLEEHVDRPALPRRTWLSTKAPMHAANGEVIGLVGVSVDITEHKRLEDRQRLMINELNHRVKNTLATVQAITARTLRGIDPAIRRTLEDRFLAIASAHDVLTHEKWEGAGLHDVAAAVLAPFGYPDPDRIGVRGPALMLRPGAALALAMGLHELATNALKYGAWSTASGRVELTWDLTHDTARQIRLAWQERSGPPVVPPLSRGFGTRLLERSLAQDLGGSVRIGFDDPAGVSCLIEAPLAEVAATDAKDFALAGQC